MIRIQLSFFFIIINFLILNSQEREIVRILNHELKKQIKHQLKNPNYDGITILLSKEFCIDQNKILSVEIKKSNENGYSLERQEVPLSKIKIIGKDINIILETDDEDVKTLIRRFYKNEEMQELSNESTMFFTYLHFPYNEDVGDDLIKAFSKAGYKITKSYWYD